MSGIFHHMSLAKPAPQFQQTRSLLGTIRLQRAQGRRGAVVSRPHAPQNRAAAGAPQKGHAREGRCAAAGCPPAAAGCLSS
ncbi:MAG TPA: hypothetical protein VE360_12970 [Pyrinomonadaceae bacterium]|nr:hypothetical protein [Pyrinomonadaceae bacterium]